MSFGYEVTKNLSQCVADGLHGAVPLSRRLQGYNEGNFLSQLCGLARHASWAVMQYHSTPWLPDVTTMSQQILIKDTSDVYLRFQDLLDNRPIEAIKHDQNDQSVDERTILRSLSGSLHEQGIRNEALLGLGIILLELESGKSLEIILASNSQVDWGPTFTHQKINDSLVSKLGLPRYRAGYRMGAAYGNIVRMCLDCDFGLGLRDYSLEHKALQEAVYEHMISRLQILESSFKNIGFEDEVVDVGRVIL